MITPITSVESWELKRLTVAYSSGPSVSISITLPLISGSVCDSNSVAKTLYDDINKVRSNDKIYFCPNCSRTLYFREDDVANGENIFSAFGNGDDDDDFFNAED